MRTPRRRAGIPFSLSTLGTRSIEEVKAANPNGRNWFQLYMWKDRDRSMALVERAAAAGFDTLLVTVDVPVAGARLRDTRNGMSIPPALTLRTVLDAVPHPRWWFDLLTTEPLSFASLDRWPGTVAEYLDTMFDPTVTFDDLAWIKSQWPNKLVVKGIQTLEDAKAVVDLGVDGIVLSNHGGRQLDRAPVPFHLLPTVAREVGGDTEIVLDTGIMSGADIVAAIALGARFTLVGRAYLYGLMAGGEAGVDRAIAILSEQVAPHHAATRGDLPGGVDAAARHPDVWAQRLAGSAWQPGREAFPQLRAPSPRRVAIVSHSRYPNAVLVRV